MEKAVDEVISRLAEIEDTANRMNEAVEVRKKEISAEMEAKTKDFDDSWLLRRNAGLMNCSRSLKKKKKKRSPA